jgi:hypothetical protein
MEIIAHGLWAAAAAIGARRSGLVRIQVHRTVGWTVFPDVLAFGPSLAAGLWLKVSGGPAPSAEGHLLPHVHLGLPLYPIGHSLVIALLVFGVASLAARGFVIELFGWALHILIDIPTHSLRYYATRFLWPVSSFQLDGIAWWTPWFWSCTYLALALVYLAIWWKGWLQPGSSNGLDRDVPASRAEFHRRETGET